VFIGEDVDLVVEGRYVRGKHSLPLQIVPVDAL
jgi:hypothetical protein